ncbi:MAG: Holliday junction branch migration protein RuvA [Phycisphaeraceae bacterium]
MIAQIEGTLESVATDRVLLRLTGGVTVELLLPGYAAARLQGRVGEAVALHTLLYIESQAQGATLLPRLAGFLTAEDRAFFLLFVTCKGIGYRKALRAMALSTPQLAAAIADHDLATLQSLPEVGRRGAENIVMTLREKVTGFLDVPGGGGRGEGVSVGGDGRGAAGGGGSGGSGGVAREALAVLLQLGEPRAEAQQWIDRVLTGEDPPRDAQGLISEIYRLRGGR